MVSAAGGSRDTLLTIARREASRLTNQPEEPSALPARELRVRHLRWTEPIPVTCWVMVGLPRYSMLPTPVTVAVSVRAALTVASRPRRR